MKRLVLSLLLLCPTSFMAREYPSLVAYYLDGIQMEDQEQHDRVEQALLSLERMHREDLVIMMGCLCLVLQKTVEAEEDCGCDCCCDDVIDEIIEQDYANCGIEHCC